MLRYSTTVCLAVVMAVIFELHYTTASEDEQEDEICALVEGLAEQCR